MTAETQETPQIMRLCPVCGQLFFTDCLVCPEDNCPLDAKAPQQLIGMIFNQQYRLLSLLGKGEMAYVFLAREKTLGKDVALKLLHLSLLNDKESVARFKQEGLALSNLSHPNIVAAGDFGVTRVGQPYLVMDYLKGSPLDSRLSSGQGFEPGAAVRIIAQICDALTHAHEKGVVHRDLKPSNIMLIEQVDGGEKAMIVDFGIARLMQNFQTETSQKLTKTGRIFGTPFYMSPEQWRGEKADERSDIYSLGCVAYEMIAGSKPYDVDTLVSLMLNGEEVTLTALSERKSDTIISFELEAVVSKAMQIEKEQRYQSVAELKAGLMKTGEYAVSQNLRVGRSNRSAWLYLQRRWQRIVSIAIISGLLLVLFSVVNAAVTGFSGKGDIKSTEFAIYLKGIFSGASDRKLFELRKHLACLYLQNGRNSDAARELEIMSKSLKDTPNGAEEIYDCIAELFLLKDLAKMPRAAEGASMAQQYLQDQRSLPIGKQIELLAQLAPGFDAVGNRSAADKCFAKMETLIHHQGASNLYAAVINLQKLAQMRNARKDYVAAERNHLSCIPILNALRLGSSEMMRICLCQLADVQLTLKKRSAGIAAFEKVLSISERGKVKDWIYLTALERLSKLSSESKDYKKAEKYMSDYAANCKAEYVREAYCNLSRTYLADKLPERAIESLKQGLLRIGEGKTPSAYDRSFLESQLGEIMLCQKKNKDAEGFLQESLKLAATIPETLKAERNGLMAIDYHYLGRIVALKSQFEQACDLFCKSAVQYGNLGNLSELEIVLSEWLASAKAGHNTRLAKAAEGWLRKCQEQRQSMRSHS